MNEMYIVKTNDSVNFYLKDPPNVSQVYDDMIILGRDGYVGVGNIRATFKIGDGTQKHNYSITCNFSGNNSDVYGWYCSISLNYYIYNNYIVSIFRFEFDNKEFHEFMEEFIVLLNQIKNNIDALSQECRDEADKYYTKLHKIMLAMSGDVHKYFNKTVDHFKQMNINIPTNIKSANYTSNKILPLH